MNRNEASNIEKLNQNEQKETLYNEIRDVQIELKKYCSQKNFELFLINKESRINDKDMKNFKIELKKYYIQQFFIQISIQKINPRFLYNIDPEITNDKEKTSNFTDIINNSISFNEFVQLSMKIPINDFFQIYLWTFSIIPSYFNFFLSDDDESYFLFFLEKLKADDINHFYIYSTIIFYHPLFLNFCKNVFDPVFEPILHEDKDQHDPPSKCLQNLQKTIHLCPSIIKKVLLMIPESERMNHVHRYFYEPLVLFPHRFFVLPEYYVLPHRQIQVLNLAIDNFIIELIESDCSLNLHFQDRNNLLFASFDLEFIKYRMALSRRRISTGPVNQQKLNQIKNLNDSKRMNPNQNRGINPNATQRSNADLNQNRFQNSQIKQNQNQQIQYQKLNQNQQINQNHDKVPSFNQSQNKPNQAQIPQINQNQVQNAQINSTHQNQSQIPSFNQNQNQQMNQSQIPSFKQNQSNQNQIPQMNQNQSPQIMPSNQNQAQNPQFNSINQNKNPSFNQNQGQQIQNQQMNQNQYNSQFRKNQNQAQNSQIRQNQAQIPSFGQNQNQQDMQNQMQAPSFKSNQSLVANQNLNQSSPQQIQLNQSQVPQFNQTQPQQIKQNQNQTQNPQFNQNQQTNQNQNQIQNQQTNQNQNQIQNQQTNQNTQLNQNQNQTQNPQFNQNQQTNQNQIQNQQTNQNQNQIQNQQTNQNQNQNQTQNPQLIQNQQTNQIPQFNQNSSQQTKLNQAQIPSFGQNSNQNQQSQNQNQNQAQNQAKIQAMMQTPQLYQAQAIYPLIDQTLNSKSSRRYSMAPTKNSNPNPNPNSSRRLSLSSKNQSVNSDKSSETSDSSSSQRQRRNSSSKSKEEPVKNINKSQNFESLPKSNFNATGVTSHNRKRSVSAVSKMSGDLGSQKNSQKSINNYKYFFVEVSKDQDRHEASEFLSFEKCLSDSFFSSTDEIFPLSKSLSFTSSSSSSIFLSDWQNAFLATVASSSSSVVSSSHEEIATFFHNFRKLLQESDPLPLLDFKCENNLNMIDILYEFLVKKGGSFSNFIERAACFESIRDYLSQIGGNDLRRMITTYKKMAHSMKELIDDKKSFISYMKKTKFLFDRTFIFYKLVFRLGDTFLYDESRRKTSKEIVDDPYAFYLDFEKSRSIDPVIAKIQYHAFIHNLRFYDFCKAHPELSKYDKLAFKFIEVNRESVIHSQPKSAKLFDKLNLIKDRFLFDPIVKNIQRAFEINAVPYEKFEIIRKCFENVEGWLKNVMEYGADDMLPFTIFIFALANPKMFISNTVFMNLFLLSSIWNIEPNEAPVVSTRLKSFIGLIFHTFSELTSFLPLKTFKIEILYILDYSKLSNNENNQENNNQYIKKSNYTCLIDSVDEDKIREIGKPFRTIYQDESPYLGELIFYDVSQSFSMNLNTNTNTNVDQNTNQNLNENENSGVITNIFSNFGSKKNSYDLLIVESDRIEFAKKAVSKNKNIQKKIIFCNKNVSEEMKQLDIQCFKILPRFSLCKALKEIMNLFVKIE